MRDVFNSDGVQRDDDDPFVPGQGGGSRRKRSRSAFDWGNVSHALMPSALRDRAVSVSVQTHKREYRPGEPVHFRVKLANRIPFPVALRTRSPVLWHWGVDGVERASHVPEERPDVPGLLRFARSERKSFERRWHQRIQNADGRWMPVEPGEYRFSAWVNVENPAERGLAGETTITVG